MEGIPLALVTEMSPMFEVLVTGNLECTSNDILSVVAAILASAHQRRRSRGGSFFRP